ncbi:MAG: hypothetical protein KI790_21080, partial [Cyclobacteriaceae bacterium]|nr:hypothetical protein [Cyclobacteriaceae bacterium HetDA_MAG_MS6]
MIDELGLYQGFTLANNFYGEYEAGHGIRRDGNGLFPPPVADPTLPHDDNTNAKAFESARFPADFTVRAKLPVGTDGYPDVDTWRDLEFYVEGRSN